jgi:hypothetical protein
LVHVISLFVFGFVPWVENYRPKRLLRYGVFSTAEMGLIRIFSAMTPAEKKETIERYSGCTCVMLPWLCRLIRRAAD